MCKLPKIINWMALISHSFCILYYPSNYFLDPINSLKCFLINKCVLDMVLPSGVQACNKQYSMCSVNIPDAGHT